VAWNHVGQSHSAFWENFNKHEKGERTMENLLKRLWQEEEGQDLIEYALLVALIALAATVGMNSLATAINNEFTNLGTSLTAAT
jgi:pilus assembly protein Flp/PilA